MGRYADPQIIVDKRFEKVRGELNNLYKNVDANLQLIGKRKQARKAAQAKKYGDFGDVYNKAVKDSRASSRKFARTRPDMAKDAKKQFSDQIAGRFDEGYDNIQAFVRGQYISKEGEEPIKNPTESQINAFVQSQIDAANDLGESLVAFEGLSNAHAKGIKAGDGSDGKKTGSVVIGSEFSNIFSAMTGDAEGQEDIQWSKMKISGSLTGGTTIYFDGQSEGEEGFGIADPDTEVIDLSKMKTNYMNGNQEVYFQDIKDKTQIAEDIGPVLKTVQKNKEIEFQEVVRTTKDDGTPVEMEIPNKRRRQDYFINGKGSSVTVDAMIEKHGGITATVQAYYGANIAAQFPEPGEEGYDQAMLKLKARMYEDLDPLMNDGTRNLLSPNKKTSSKQYTKDTSADVVKGFYKDVHKETGRMLPQIPSQDALNEYNLYIQDRPYSQGGNKNYTIDHMEPAGDGNPSHMVLIMKEGNKKVRHEGFFDVSTPEGRRKLEEGLMKGNFQGSTDRRHVDGLSNSNLFYGDEDAGEYNGSEKESVRITNSKIEGGITFQEYQNKIEGSEKELNHKNIDWPWQTDGSGGGSQAAALNNVTPSSQTQPANNSVQAQLGIQPQAATPPAAQVGQLSETSFGGGDYSSNTRVGDAAVYKNDGSLDDQYRKIINFETIGGLADGTGTPGYGFTDTNTYPDTPKSPEEAVKYIKTAVVPKVEDDLGFKLSELDSIPKNVTASLVDYKMNTGRSMDDLLIIAYQNQQAGDKSDADNLNKTWDGLKAVKGKAPKPTKEVYDALKAGEISAEAIAAAKDELYLGRIKVMKDNNSPKLKAAVEAYRNSHSNRVNMFK